MMIDDKKGELESRQRKEAKELMNEITALKKTVAKGAGDKKKKKEVQDKIALMQHDLDTRHAKEMVELEQQLKSSTTVESKNDSCTLSANMEPLAPSTSLVNDNNDETGTEAEELDELPSESISSSFYASNTSASGAKKPNRQKLRKLKKAAQMEEMRQQALEEASNSVDMKAVEEKAIDLLLSTFNLRIKDIIPDGHCLFNAVSHQLEIVEHPQKLTYKELRRLAGEYMRTHPDDYMPFLTDDNDDMMSTEGYEKYCNDVINTATWGGQLEIQALSKCLKKQIHIFQMGSPVIKVGEFDFPSDSSPLLISTYNKYWEESHVQLKDRLEYESPKDPSIIPKERSAAFQHIAVLYVKYIQIFKKMELSYDQMVHPQKRRALKENVLSVLGRILELRHKMVELESSDFHNFSDILFDMKLSHEDLKVSIPNFYIEERVGELENRQALLDSLNAKVFGQDQPPLFPEIKLSDAIRMIQLNERGRQGQLRAKYMRDIRLQAQREKDMDGGDDENEIQKAALKIQTSFKGFLARSKFQKKMHDELVFLGLEAPVKDSKSNPLLKSEANRQRRKVLQKQHEEEYQQALVNTKEKILKVEGPDMKEGIQDNFRQWYMEYKRLNGKLPEFPADRVWQQANFSFMNQDAQAGDQGDGDASVADDSKPQSEGSKKKPGSAEKKKGAAGKDEEVKEESFKFDSSDFIGKIKSSQGVYKNEWQSKDESENFAQKHDQDIIKATKRKEVEAEIKESVMEILKEELKNLKSAVERESGKKGKKGRKKSAKGKKKGKKGKDKKAKGAKGGKKGKKEKDLTSNRTMESLIEELVQTGLLQKVPKVPINDFKGTFNLLAVSGAKTPIVDPTLGELQRVISEYCILPLGYPKSEEGNGILPIPSVAKMFLCGPKGSGKTMLVNTIASEIGAHVFNLTPKNTAGQFVGKPNVTKMIHMVFKVAKANPPAVIYIDNFEMVFAKKVPKDDLSDPKRIKKDLLKNLKSLAPEDRVLFVGLSSKPWDGDAKVMLPIFEKFILCPKPDYPSRYMIWREFIGKAAPGNIDEINISLLSRLSAGMTTGQMKACSERAMTERRMKLIRTRPLNSNEFAHQIINCMPFNQEEDKLFQEWYEKTPLPKKRSSMLSGPVEEDVTDKKKK